MSHYRSLEGKLAIVTGGSRGIGAVICENLASKGCNLIMNYTSSSSAEPCSTLASKLQNKHSIKAHAVQADISSPIGPNAIVQATLNHFGPKPTINILINNAGVAANAILETTSAEKITADFHKQYATNVLGPLLLTQAVIPYLPTDRSGRIVNLSSVSSSLGFEGQSVYGGTKAALEAMTRTWARELKFRATVNSINPGPVATDMYSGTSAAFQTMMRPFCQNAPGMSVKEDLDGEEAVRDVEIGGADGKGTGGRAGTPVEIAGVVGMLVSEEAGWTTGCVICANGGMIFGL